MGTTRRALAFSYLRFSSPEQAKGDSVRRQTEARDAWLARHPTVSLDTSLTLHDRGVSGFSGKHRENPDRHALAAFLKLVEAGRIPEGSYLLLENLDRLSREHIRPALTLLLNLIEGGVRVVQLMPAEQVFDKNVEPMQLMMAIMELSRGHSESATKSIRVGGAWKVKKERAALGEVCHKMGGKVLTARCPCWLRVVGGQLVKDETACAAVRRIFSLCREGHGIGIITKKLNAEKVQAIGRGKRSNSYWARSYVAKILANRAVMGEYQPHTRRGGQKRRPEGDPIANYFPAVITEQEWYAAKAALTGRKGKPGRLPENFINPFQGLLKDARSGGTLHRVDKGKKNGAVLIPYLGELGVNGERATSFPFPIFEQAVLRMLSEVDPNEIVGNGEAEKVHELTGRLVEVERRIRALQDALLTGEVQAVVEVLRRQESLKTELAEQLARARQALATPLASAWEECQSLTSMIERDPGLRVRLRSALRRIVDSVWVLVVPRGRDRLAAVQVWFAEGNRRRDYIILHRPGSGGRLSSDSPQRRQPAKPAQWWARSLAELAPGDLDLRKIKDARQLEAALAGADLSAEPDGAGNACRPERHPGKGIPRRQAKRSGEMAWR
jgi:DNA invertase Pin-like site-specific DNA recombinase